MGLIQAGMGAVSGVLADQWKEFFYCESMDKDTLMVKGEKRITSRSTNTKGNDNIISNGSGIAVADGQAMIIVEQGKVVEFCAEPGQFTYNTSTEPSIFTGKLGDSIKETFKLIGKRFTYGGDTGKDQRVYYFNTKELIDNKFGTQNPVPFRVVDRNIGLDIDISVRCNGVYSYRIADPLLFYTSLAGNVKSEYKRDEIDGQLKGEFLNALQPAFAKISELGIRYSALPGHTMELSEAMNEVLTHAWYEKRGLAVVSVAINSITAPKEDEDMIKELQKTAVMRDPTMAGATYVSATADAMRTAAGNQNGAMTGFMGMGMAMNAGGANNVGNLFAMGQQQQQQQAASAAGGWTCPKCGAAVTGNFCPQCGEKKPEPKPAPAAGGWTCAKCGAAATGKFCPECGAPKPAEAEGWTCTKCGAVNKGKFCAECGTPKPAGAPLYRCDKCGWEPEDPKNPPKFCPECGDPFDENDAK